MSGGVNWLERVHVPLDTKRVVPETLFSANLSVGVYRERYQIRDGLAARQQREGLTKLVVADEFADDGLGTGDDESARTADDDRQKHQPRVASVRHHRQTNDLEYQTDDRQTEVVAKPSTNSVRNSVVFTRPQRVQQASSTGTYSGQFNYVR